MELENQVDSVFPSYKGILQKFPTIKGKNRVYEIKRYKSTSFDDIKITTDVDKIDCE